MNNELYQKEELSGSPAIRWKEVFGWAMFDFANSAFTTVMVTAFFGLYFQSVVVGGSPGSTAKDGEFMWGLSLSISQFIVIIFAPTIGAVADFSSSKKKFLFVTYLGCSLGTLSLGWVGSGDVALAMTLFIIANVCFSSGENLVSAFLPEIAPQQWIGRISGFAWGLGYVGGVGALLGSVLILKYFPENGYPMVWAFIGIWFLVGGAPTFIFLKETQRNQRLPQGQTIWTIGFHRLYQTYLTGEKFKQLFRFFWSTPFIFAGVAAVIGFSSRIAQETMHFEEMKLGIFLMVISLSASIGAMGIGLIQDKIGSLRAIQGSLVAWILAIVLALITRYLADGSDKDTVPRLAEILFWITGNLVGMAMGGVFSSSRALVGLFSPEAKAGEFFGLWGFFGKLGSVIGPFSYGWMSSTLGATSAIIMLGCFFILGLIGVSGIDEKEGRQAAVEIEANLERNNGELQP